MQLNIEWLARELRIDSPSADDLAALTAAFEAEFVAAGMPMIHQGTSVTELYFVHSGKVRIVHKNSAHVVTLNARQDSRTFGEISFFGDEPATADVLAETPCEVYKISCAKYHALMQQHPKLAMKLMAYVLRSMGDIIRKLDRNSRR